MDDDVGDLGLLAPDPLLDLTGARMRLGQAAPRVEREREESDEALAGAEEPHLPGSGSGHVANDPLDGRRVDRLLGSGQRLGRLLGAFVLGAVAWWSYRDRPLERENPTGESS